MKISCPHCGKEIDQKLVTQILGKQGGLKTKKRGKAHFSEAGKKGMASRWRKD